MASTTGVHQTLTLRHCFKTKMTERCTCGACLLSSSVTMIKKDHRTNGQRGKPHPCMHIETWQEPAQPPFQTNGYWAKVTMTRSQCLQVADDITTRFWCLFVFFKYFFIYIYIYTQWEEVSQDGQQILYIPVSYMSTDASSFILFTHIFKEKYFMSISAKLLLPISLIM